MKKFGQVGDRTRNDGKDKKRLKISEKNLNEILGGKKEKEKKKKSLAKLGIEPGTMAKTKKKKKDSEFL